MPESLHRIRVGKLSEGREDDLKNTTAEERLGMMWQLALDAWAFKGEPIAEPRGQHVVRTIRGRR